MTKYSSELKVQVASDYLNDRGSYNGLSKKYNITPSLIRTWVKAVELNGLESLKVKRTKREYSVDFKLDVVSYYLKSDEGRNLVAAKFNISPSQVIHGLRSSNEAVQRRSFLSRKVDPLKCLRRARKSSAISKQKL